MISVVRAETLTVIVTHQQVKQKESENTDFRNESRRQHFFTGAHINTENVLIITRTTPTTETQKTIEEFFTSVRFCCTKSMKAAKLFKCGEKKTYRNPHV